MSTIRKSAARILVFLLIAALLPGFTACPVKASSNTQSFSAGGVKYSLTYTYKNSKYTFRLYKNTGSGRQRLASLKTGWFYLTYSGKYKKKLYFTARDTGRVKLYSYTIGKSKFVKEKDNVGITGLKGKYAIGGTAFATDVSGSSLCLYNVATKKVKPLKGKGYSPKRIGNKFYYVTINQDYTKFSVIRCNPSGSGKKVLLTKKSQNKATKIYGIEVFKDHVTYTSTNGSSWKQKKAKF